MTSSLSPAIGSDNERPGFKGRAANARRRIERKKKNATMPSQSEGRFSHTGVELSLAAAAALRVPTTRLRAPLAKRKKPSALIFDFYVMLVVFFF